jgi:cell division septation protein DedD
LGADAQPRYNVNLFFTYFPLSKYFLIYPDNQSNQTMSRLDYITILIVVVGIAALGYLIYKIYQNNSQQQSRVNQVETPYEPGQETDDETATYPSEEDYNNSITPQDDDYYDEEGTGFEESSAAQQEEGQSATTAKEDEFTNKGTEEQETAPVNDDFDNTSTPSSYGNYMVIAGTFSIKQNAENQARKLRQMGYSSASTYIFDRGAYAVVIVDRFDNLSDANRLKKELMNDHNIEAIVQKKK